MTQGVRHNRLVGYGVVTSAYWSFMLSDGALRMLVLLNFHERGFSPILLAFLFLLYEFMGVITNLLAGWVVGRFGLNRTLFLGLGLQVVALTLLGIANPATIGLASVLIVVVLQGLSGIAKDLTKLSAKSALKRLAPDTSQGETWLLVWVARLTGSKNAIKGLGFFLGAALLQAIGFQVTLAVLAIGLTLVLVGALVSMPSGLDGNKDPALPFTAVFSNSSGVNRLSLARFFLFSARDVWFVVGVPLFFYAQGWTFQMVGTFMAIWIIGYGFVQAATPNILRRRFLAQKRDPTAKSTNTLSFAVGALRLWGALPCLALLVLAGTVPIVPLDNLLPVIALGLFVFGAFFAVNSALHSFLILAYSEAEDVALDVGFYYMSNAGGRLVGTFLSGLIFQSFNSQLGDMGLIACLATAALFSLAAWLLAFGLPRAD